MSIGKTVSLKIYNYNLLNEEFIKIIEKINRDNKFSFVETPLDYAWGYQEHNLNLRVNFSRSKSKVEFVAIYDEYDELKNYIKAIESFVKIAELNFKAISLAFGLIYIDYPSVNYKFILPEFKNDKSLKYKLTTDIHNNENGDIYLSSNFHFYNFKNVSHHNNPKDIIIKDLLPNFSSYYEIFVKMTGINNG